MFETRNVASCINSMGLCRFYMIEYKNDPVLVGMFRKQWEEWRRLIPYYRNSERQRNTRTVPFWSENK